MISAWQTFHSVDLCDQQDMQNMLPDHQTPENTSD